MGGQFTLADVESLANRFAETHLTSYTAQIRQSAREFARKEINDALWGTVGLTPIEVVILDSPLVQRLRYVRQLGVVHWIYPGAVHTRFEHTVGVLYQVHHLTSSLNAIAASSGSQGQPLIGPSFTQLLRLTALLHDVGHAAFSHVSEMAMEMLPELTLIRAEFSKKETVEQKQLSEIFAFYIVRSPAMLEMLELLMDRCETGLSFDANRQRNLQLIVQKISDAIIGRKIDDRLPLLHELISGPFDADKLDYFVRDAKLAGTPSLLDISRLVQKLTVRFLESDELPVEIGRSVEAVQGRHCLFGIKWSGVAVLDELQLARVLLYAKIYRHPKVIAIEQMMRAAIQTIAKTAPIQSVLRLLYSHADDALLMMTKETLAAALELDPGALDADALERLSLAEEILKAVRDRRLWVRAYQIAGRYPVDPLFDDKRQKEGLISFIEQVEHPQHSEKFIGKLHVEVQRILELQHAGEAPSRTALQARIMMHVLNSAAPGGTQIARAYVLPNNGKPMPFREYTVNRTGWADSYLSDQPKGYIFCPPEIADAVFVAVEKLIRIEHGVRLPPSALEVSKRESKTIDECKRELVVGHYYRGTPIDVRPQPKRLQRADVTGKIAAFDRLRAAYQEPPIEFDADELPVAPSDRTMTWLRQFDDEGHVDCALRLIENFKMLRREDTVSALRAFIGQHPEFKGGWVVPFGSARDSSAIQAYFSADLAGTLIERCLTLEEASREQTNKPIIFLDDFVATGGQTADVLAAGFEDEAMRRELSEQRSIFDDNIKMRLRSNKVGFVYTAGWDAGIECVADTAKQLKLDATVFRLIDEKEIPFATAVLRDLDKDVVDSFFQRCTEIGRSLLLSSGAFSGSRKDQTKLESRCLGYGNRAMLLGSPFNTPTQTLTALWSTGKVDDVMWYPLLARRKKM